MFAAIFKILLFLWHCFSTTFHVINFLKCLLLPCASFQFEFALGESLVTVLISDLLSEGSKRLFSLCCIPPILMLCLHLHSSHHLSFFLLLIFNFFYYGQRKYFANLILNYQFVSWPVTYLIWTVFYIHTLQVLGRVC